MGYNFPASPQVNDVYTTPTGAEYTWNGEAWDLGGAQAAPNEFVRIIGDTMTGKLFVPDPDPTAPLEATHKKYVDRIVAEQTLWQGIWQVAANTPDLDPAVMLPLAGYSWTCQTINPNIPEIAPATLPGIGGLTIAAGDTVKWNEVNAVYDLIRAAIGISRMLVADTPPPVAIAGQQWWDSDAGKMYVRYEDPSGGTTWVQVSGGGGGSRYIVPVSDVAPVATEEGELWFNSTDASLYVWFDDGTGAQWVDVSGGSTSGGGLADAPADGTEYLRKDNAWVNPTTTVVQATGGHGDVKMGFQGTDHVGWVRLDGRAITALTPTQQDVATNVLGFTTNIPDAADVVAMQPGVARAMGSVAGSWDIGLANLPDVDLTAASAGAHLHYSRSADGPIDKNVYSFDHNTAGAYHETLANSLLIGTTGTGGAKDMVQLHDSAGVHTHPVPLGGSGTPITPKNMAVNMFVFLGD